MNIDKLKELLNEHTLESIGDFVESSEFSIYIPKAKNDILATSVYMDLSEFGGAVKTKETALENMLCDAIEIYAEDDELEKFKSLWELLDKKIRKTIEEYENDA